MMDSPSASFAFIILTGQGQNVRVLPPSAAVSAHPLLAGSCSLTHGDLQTAGRFPEDKCCHIHNLYDG